MTTNHQKTAVEAAPRMLYILNLSTTKDNIQQLKCNE
jgi:hypothetical protein